jgi:hypothetical protein
MIINVRKTHLYSISGNVISCTMTGLGSQEDKSSLDCWGTTRKGKNFTSQVVTPVVWKTSCGAFVPVEGEIKTNVDGKYFELTTVYGVDEAGNAVSGSCPYGWKATWSYKKKTNKRIVPYSR